MYDLIDFCCLSFGGGGGGGGGGWGGGGGGGVPNRTCIFDEGGSLRCNVPHNLWVGMFTEVSVHELLICGSVLLYRSPENNPLPFPGTREDVM